MKAIHEKGSRTIKFTGLSGETSELEVCLNYPVGVESRCLAGIALDNQVIPAILQAINGPRCVRVIVRKWWRKGYGYHLYSTTILVDGVQVLKTGEQMASRILTERDVDLLESHGVHRLKNETFYDCAKRLGFHLSHEIVTVSRRSDL